MLNLGYRRTFNSRLFGVVTVQDVFDTTRDDITLDTPGFQERIHFTGKARTLYVGLSYTFGGGKKRAEPGFDFGSAPAP
jgi:hypothetical protein